MTCIDRFPSPVLPGRRHDHLASTTESVQRFLEHGALQIVETLGDPDVPEGKRTDPLRAVAAHVLFDSRVPQ